MKLNIIKYYLIKSSEKLPQCARIENSIFSRIPWKLIDTLSIAV